LALTLDNGVVEEPYYIERRLAAGGMAEVFVAKRLGPHGFEKRVALKRILPQFAIDTDFVYMFIDEARLAARLDHANIVQVFDFGQFDASFFIAMELIDGSNTNLLLRAVAARDEAVPLDVALHIVTEAAKALAYAHNLRDDSGEPLGIVHRDVSPANLLLTRDGHVKLSDFGIARAASFEARTQTGQLRGKLGYMSPEQVLGRDLDGRSDVFTLTTIFAEMLIAEPLFGKGTDLDVLMRIRDVDLSVLDRSKRRVPPDVRAVIEQGLAKNPEDRPDSATYVHVLSELAQRRGIANATMSLSALLVRLALIERRPGEEPFREAPKKAPPNYLDLTSPARPDDLAESPALGEAFTYRVRTETGQIGPVTLTQLIELMLCGEMDADTMVSTSGGPFVRAAQLEELKRFVSSAALQWRGRELASPTEKGALARAALLPIVHKLATNYETGVLYLSAEGRRKKIYFVDGRPDFIASTDRKELLGEYLVASGDCLRMEVDMALAVMSRYDGRLGDALVGLSALRPISLVRAVRAQSRQRFLEAFSWRSGEWAYIRGAVAEEETFAVTPDPYELMRDAAYMAHPEELEAALEPIRERILLRNPTPPIPVHAYRVPEPWQRLLENLNGRSTLGSIVAYETALGAVDVEDIYRALYLGLSCQLISSG
jgi:serine/threonine-protein kinase